MTLGMTLSCKCCTASSAVHVPADLVNHHSLVSFASSGVHHHLDCELFSVDACVCVKPCSISVTPACHQQCDKLDDQGALQTQQFSPYSTWLSSVRDTAVAAQRLLPTLRSSADPCCTREMLLDTRCSASTCTKADVSRR